MTQEGTSQLSPLDAAFLYFERPHQRLHVGCVALIDGQVPFEPFSRTLGERLGSITRYRQRPVRPPLDLGLPRWEEDPRFELRRHLRHVAVPRPGDAAALTTLASELFATSLDTDRPLWEAYLVDGLGDGGSALLFKVHHSMIDGVSGAQVLEAIADPLEETTRAATPFAPRRPDDGLLARLRAATDPAYWMARAGEAIEFSRVARELLFSGRTPDLPFLGPLSDARRLVWTSFPLDHFLAIRGVAGVKLNDVVLAVIAGALRRYLQGRGLSGSPAAIRALVPVSIRRPEERMQLGNLVTALFPSLPLDEPDPRLRLARVASETRALKARGQDRASGFFLSLAGRLPAPLSALSARLMPERAMVQTVITNVPGPRQPRTFLGHTIREVHPIVPLFWGMGLEFAVLSYGDRLSICAAVDPHLVPDADALREALHEEAGGLSAALTESRPTPAPRSASNSAVRVADIMTDRVVAVAPDLTLVEAWQLMTERRIRHLPVVDPSGRLLGLVTHRDLLAAASSSLDGADRRPRALRLDGHRVAEIMEAHVRTVHADDPAGPAGECLVQHRIGCLPVVDGQSQLVGIVTESDYLRWATSRMEGSAAPPPLTRA